MKKRVLCFVIAFLILMQFVISAVALDTFFPENHVNYSWSRATTQEQCNNAYAYLSTVMDTRYTEKIYDLIYRAQYRLTLFGGDNWAYLNTGTDTTLVEDSVLGNIPIFASRGCNSYARYAAKYVRQMQGTLVRASSFLGKTKEYVPNAAEIKQFVENYADVGERILTGYYNSGRKEPRPHSLVYLGEDPQKDGFYFLCQDGDGNGQTMRYYSYDYMATRLRYYAEYGYALAIGDTNSGKDAASTDSLFGAVDDSILKKLHFSQETGFTTTITGWALSKRNTPVHVRAYVDGSFLAQASAISNAKIRSIFPVWDTTDKSGFSLSLNTSCLCTGKHVLDIFAEDGSNRVLLKSVNIQVSNMVYALETPTLEETVVLTADEPLVCVQGWCFDRSGEHLSYSYSIDNSTRYFLQAQERKDVSDMPGCQYSDIGFTFTLELENLSIGVHSIRVYASSDTEVICISTFSVYVVPEPGLQRNPIQLQISRLPDQLEYDFGEPVSLDGMLLEVVYDDLSVNVLRDGFSTLATTDIPGNQTVVLLYEGISADFSIYVRNPIAPQSIKLTAERDVLAPLQTTQITASIQPDNAQAYSIVWKSSDSSVAIVSDDGSIKSVARGECEIIAVVYDYYGNEVCRESTTIQVKSAFRIFLLRVRQWILRLFRIRSITSIFES